MESNYTEIFKQLDKEFGFIQVNRGLITMLGLNNAIMFQSLVKMQELYSDIQLDDNGYFYATFPTVQTWTGLTESQQRTATNKLVKLGLIYFKVETDKGRQKRYYKVADSNTVMEILNGLYSNLNYRDYTKDRKRAGDILTDMSKIMQGSKKRKKAKNKSSDTPAKKAQRKSGITF